MKTLLKKTLILISISVTVFTVVSIMSPTSVYADVMPCTPAPLGLNPWYCNVQTPWDDSNLTSNIWLIVANVLTDIGVIAAYLVVGYVIYGGYLYMFSSGDPGKAMNGKKTLTRAFIGLAIVMLSNVILNTIRFALLQNSGSFSDNCATSSCVDPDALIVSTLNWFIATAGIVAAVFVVVGGVGYITSAGDPGKLQKAKTTITYALIGLAIVALAEIIVAFVSGVISNAEETARIEQTLIAKEYHEN